MSKQIKRGEIYYADLSPIVGSEQGGYRPVLIAQNDMGNKFSPTTIVAIITSRRTKAKLPTQHWISGECGLRVDSMVECEQLRCIDKSRLRDYVGRVNDTDMAHINKCIKISLGVE